VENSLWKRTCRKTDYRMNELINVYIYIYIYIYISMLDNLFTCLAYFLRIAKGITFNTFTKIRAYCHSPNQQQFLPLTRYKTGDIRERKISTTLNEEKN
jgi:hypothetical protein